MAAWQTHRFGDCVAVSTGTGETVYLPLKEARAMARAINAAARSIAAERFADSSGLTRTGQAISPQRENRTCPRMERDATGRALRYAKGEA